MKYILIINQSSELYGSDKAILELIKDFPKGYIPIVVLEDEGPLKKYLEKIGVKVIKSSVIKVQRGNLNFLFFLKLPWLMIGSILSLKSKLKSYKISVVHSNSISVFLGSFYALVFRIPHLWHIHEIIEKPKLIAKLYPTIISVLSKKVVFNSIATQNHYLKINPRLKKQAVTIYNGLERKQDFLPIEQVRTMKQQVFGAKNNEIIISLIGRISQIKGQKILVQAFNQVSKIYPNTRLVLVGSYLPSKKYYYDELIDMISGFNLSDKVSILDFQSDIWRYYDASDIVVMPSTEPESFGLVAAEALLSKKAVVAANIGALPEIVIHQSTGLLFKANNHEDLSQKLIDLLSNISLQETLATNGHHHVKLNFSSKKMIDSFQDVYAELS